MKKIKQRNRLSTYLVLVFIVSTVTILVSGYLYFAAYEKHYGLEIKNELAAIADLKVNELVSWRNERINDARFFFNNYEFESQVKLYLDNTNDLKTKSRIESAMRHVFNTGEYDAFFLLDSKFEKKITVSQGPERIFSFLSQNSIDSLHTGKIIFEDFYYNDVSKKIFLKILVPIMGGEKRDRLIATVVLRIDPEKYLYPFIQRWPTLSKSAETLIIHKEGDDVVFLNELRFQKNSALKFRFNINKNKELTAVKAVLGQTGFTEGIDYRGMLVLAEIRAIPNSPWFIVARIDKSELYESFKDRMWIVLFLILTLLLSITAIFGFIWRHQRVNYYKEKLEAAGQLKKSEENFAITFNSIGDAVVSTDADGNVVRMNPVAEKLCGWTLDEALGKPLTEVFRIINAETRLPVVNPVNLVMETGQIIGLANHTLLISKDGSEYQIADSAAPIKNENGGILGVVLVFSDVTEDYAVQEKLRSNERFLDEAQKIARIGVYNFDIQKNVWSSSEILNQIFGIEPDFDKSLSGWTSIIHADWKELMNDYFTNEVIGKRERFDKEYKIIRKKNLEERWVHGLGELIFNTENEPVRMIGTIQDITERKLAEENIHLMKASIDVASDGAYWMNEDGKFLFVNAAGCEELGYSEEEILQMRIFDINPRVNAQQWKEVWHSVKKLKTYTSESIHRRKDGSEFPVEIKSSFIKFGDQEYINGFARNLSERKKSEKQIIESELKYRQLVNSMEQGIALHEMIYNENGEAVNYRFIEVNKSFETLTGLKRENILGKTLLEIMPETEKYWIENYDRVVKTGESLQYQNYAKEIGKYFDVVAFRPHQNQFAVIITDITERRRSEEERERTIKLLALINVQNNTQKLMEEVCSLMKEWSTCESVGIRLKDKEDYPYYVSDGFDKKFILKENSLCSVDKSGSILRDSTGNPILECMCGNVIQGRSDPSKSFFTEKGSFWSNCTTDLLTSTTETDRQARTRNRCNGEGYESVALIPLRTGNETLGLLQFNDRHKNKFTKEKIILFERLANNLAIALSQKNAQSLLRKSELKHRTLFETMYQGVIYADNKGRIIDANTAAENILGVNYDELLKYFVFDEIWQAVKEDGSKYDIEEFPVMRALKTGKDVKNVVMCILSQKDGSRKWLNINAIPQFEGDETAPKQILTTFEDISERKHSREKILNSLREKEILLREIHHRVKNNFQVISSLLNLQSNLYTDENILNIFRDSQNRIKSMSLIHELVYRAEDFSYLDVQNYVGRLIEYLKSSYAMSEEQITIAWEIDRIGIELDDLIPIGLILNELISNIYKHAFPGGRNGTINIYIKHGHDDRYNIIVRDNGVGLPKDYNSKDRKSLGMFLINSLVKQIKGELTITNLNPGTEFLVSFSK